jgi:hypothetical protein
MLQKPTEGVEIPYMKNMAPAQGLYLADIKYDESHFK